MKRRLFTILSALSLVLCLACTGIWLRSGFVIDMVVKDHVDGRSWLAISQKGGLVLRVDNYGPPPSGWQPPPHWTDTSWKRTRWQGWSGVEWKWPSYGTSFQCFLPRSGAMPIGPIPEMSQELDLPYWLLTLSTAVFPGVWSCLWWRRQRIVKRRQGHGLCPTCGYDLRASPERCPECGSPVPTKTTA